MKLYTILLLLVGMILNGYTQSPARTGKDYAVFFYVTTFQPGWAPLPETAKEAADLKKELQDNYGFVCELIANPTKAQMRTKLREYNDKLTDKDQVLYFFSMHGYYNVGGDRGYLVGKDGTSNDLYGDTWLSYDDLRTDLALCKAKHVLLALDACHSGAFGIRNKSGPEAPAYESAEDCATQIGKTMRYAVRQYCSSGNKNAKTPAKSLFAARFLEALRKGGDEGILHFDDLEYWLGKVESPKPESGTYYGHEPGGDFIFVRKNACGTNITIKDRDGDGIPDAEDNCPDEYGIKTKGGCPDSGSSTLLADTDYDGIPDDRDGCPNEYGSAKANGCPDRDNDGVPDKSDKCKDKAGELHWQGCPDTDGDGLPDHEDDCPNQKGLAEDKGCPPPDRDDDGVPDKADLCPDKPGKAYLQGCPEPEEETPADGLILVKGGTFTMGCTSEQQDCDDDEKPAHSVTLSDFYIGQFEVTQKQWEQVMGSNPSEFKNCDNCPVENVSWDDVQAFLKKLNAKVPLGEKPYRLPTEAEWEYAARGGGKAVMFGNGKNIIDPKEVNFAGSSSLKKTYSLAGEYRAKTVPVGSLNSSNALRLHDMSGNVWEWCSDWDGAYPTSSQTNPTGPVRGFYPGLRVQRGGSWGSVPQSCRIASRDKGTPNYGSHYVGFRLARTK